MSEKETQSGLIVSDEKILLLNPMIKVYPFDAAGEEEKILCELPDKNGKVHRLALSKSLYESLKLFNGQLSYGEIVKKVFKPSDDTETIDKFTKTVIFYCTQKRLLVELDSEDYFGSERSHRPSYMLFKQALLKPRLVNLLAQFATFMFAPAIAISAMVLIILSQLIFFLVHASNFHAQTTGLTSGSIILAFAIFTGVLLLHELGHAAAAYRYGCRNVEIGFGWYIYMGVYYAELSEAWRLSRKQRVIVDCGGMYFQAIAISILVLLYFFIPSPAIYYSVLLLNFSLLMNFNPFFRLDGYWIASDWLGIVNLRSAAQQSISNLIQNIRTTTTPSTEELPKRTQKMLLWYALLSNAFFIWIVYLISSQLIWWVLGNIPKYYKEITIGLSETINTADLLVSFAGLFWQVLLLYFLAYFMINTISRIAAWIPRRSKPNTN